MRAETSIPVQQRYRWLFWLGIACAVVGIPLYVGQLLALGRTESPWYMPALATLGVVLVFLALRRRPNFWRGFALLFTVALAGLEWWFLVGYVRLPSYTGPVSAGQSFPEFTASRADGTPFTRAEMIGDRATALVFFRGHW